MSTPPASRSPSPPAPRTEVIPFVVTYAYSNGTWAWIREHIAGGLGKGTDTLAGELFAQRIDEWRGPNMWMPKTADGALIYDMDSWIALGDLGPLVIASKCGQFPSAHFIASTKAIHPARDLEGDKAKCRLFIWTEAEKSARTEEEAVAVAATGDAPGLRHRKTAVGGGGVGVEE